MTVFCKDCKNAVPDEGTDSKNFLRCQKTIETSDNVYYLVTGNVGAVHDSYCAIARLIGHPCGPEGKLFEAKP